MRILAWEKGIVPGQDVSRALAALCAELSGLSGSKTLLIQPGVYTLRADDCPHMPLRITNTAAKEEYLPGEYPREKPVAFCLEKVRDLAVMAHGAVFSLEGKMSNAALLHCENIRLEGLEFRHQNPDEHEFTVIGKTDRSVDFRLDRDSRYLCRQGEYHFFGEGYTRPFFADAQARWGWFAKVFSDNSNHIRRVQHPFYQAESVCETDDHLFRAWYQETSRFTPGERYCVFSARRDHVGIFVDSSRDISMRQIKQRFSYSLAFVAQNSENILIDGVDFSPLPEQDKMICATADFMQMCMCRGKVSISNSFFLGACDDCLNVHGIHFKIIKIEGRLLTVRFMHPQTFGFNPLRAGDAIEYVDPQTLLAAAGGKILRSELISDRDILLETDSVSGARTGMVIENISACPELYFGGNRLSRIITRGLLITTRGKVLVENNDFDNTDMAAMLFSDDAKSWYESGRCEDVTIRRNRFGDCGAYHIQIRPENGQTRSVVHGDFMITGNHFEPCEAGGIDAASARSLSFRDNTGADLGEGFITCENVLHKEISM